MKITVNQNELQNAINMTLKGVSNKNTIEILKGILFETYEGKLMITSNNLEIGVQTVIDADIQREGSVVIDAKIISDIVRKLPSSDVSLDVDETHIVKISSTSLEFNIKGFSGEDFPIPISIEENYYKEIPSEIFKEMVKKTSFAVSTDETKPLLMGELIEFKNNSISMVAIDGFRLAIKYIRDDSFIEDSKIIIPGKTLADVSRMIPSNIETIKIGFDEKHASFIIGETILTTRLLEGEFINYSQIIPKEFTTRLKINTKDFLNALDRACLVAKNNLIKIQILDDSLKISSKNDEIGNLEESIFIELEGSNLDIAFNAKYFMEALKNIDEEFISLELNTNVSPCILKSYDEDSYIYLLLPVRI